MFALSICGQTRISINIWASICGDNLFGTHVLLNGLTGRNYKHSWKICPVSWPTCHWIFDENCASCMTATQHICLIACRHLNWKFPSQWIGRGGPTAWPPRSPDLNPQDFCLWGNIKSLAYSSPVDDVETLQNKIVVFLMRLLYFLQCN
jgi:hypothetical protein